jgi:hypothetical protein
MEAIRIPQLARMIETDIAHWADVVKSSGFAPLD